MFPLVRQLHELIRSNSADEKQYKRYIDSLKSSVLTAFYTPSEFTRQLASALYSSGIRPDRVLDPSAGTGAFGREFTPQHDGAECVSFEQDLLTGLVLSKMRDIPGNRVFTEGFQSISEDYNGYFDVVASNIPFGDTAVYDRSFDKSGDAARRHSLKAVHNYFFLKGVDMLREGGLLAYITSQGVLNAPSNEPIRRWLMERCNLVSAIRLPNNLFTEYAGTEVGSDLIVLQKNGAKQRLNDSLEEEFLLSDVPAPEAKGNLLFTRHRERIAAKSSSFGKDLYGTPAWVHIFDGSVRENGERVREILENDTRKRFDKSLYMDNRPVQAQAVSPAPFETRQQEQPSLSPSETTKQETSAAVAADVTPSQETAPVSLFDLYGQGNLFAQPPQPELSAEEKSALKEQERIRTEQAAERLRMEMEPRPFTGKVQPFYRNGTIVEQDGKYGHLRGIEKKQPMFHPMQLNRMQQYRAEAYIPLRDTYHMLYRLEARNEIEYKGLRKKLNALYQNFVVGVGDLNGKENAKFILMDATGREILSLERFKNGNKVKADIFQKPVSFRPDDISHVDTAHDALIASLDRYGRVNLQYMSRLSDIEPEELAAQLEGRIFFNPIEKDYQTSEMLISGNVVQKAEWIEDYLKENPDDDLSRKALSALKEAFPTPITFDELDFNFGERWIDTDIYADFIQDLFELNWRPQVTYVESIDTFDIRFSETNANITEKYYVKGQDSTCNGKELLVHAIHNTLPNLTKVIGRDEHGNDIRVRDAEAIQHCDSKITEIRKAFSDWLLEKPDDFKQELATRYNRLFNCFVRPKYDGSYQSFPGLDLKGLGIESLYGSQKDAIWMIKQNGGGICDHEVGTGKTLIMCIAAYEMHRLGLARKPLIIGLKANIHEIASTFRTAYPDARILYPGKEDFTPDNRVRIFNDIKNNNWDCIILTHDQFGRLPQSPEIQQTLYQQEIDDIDENLKAFEARGGKLSKSIYRGLEKRKTTLRAKLNKLETVLNENKDDVTDFAQMGIDHIFVDESHNFKNLTFNTRFNRVSGLGNPEGSQKAMNLLQAIRTIQERTGRDLGATFLSGTTISNSLTELYLLFKYLRPQAMERQGITCFDGWAAVFARKTTEFEFNVTNEIVAKERFRYFIKVPELAAFYGQITDYRTAEDVGVDRPRLDEELYHIPMTPDQEAFIPNLVAFAKGGGGELLGRSELTDGEENARMLLATNYSNKMSLDMRLIGEYYEDDPGNKASVCAANIAAIYRQYDHVKGTQFVFSDLSTFKPAQWNIYAEIKRKLIEDHRIPGHEIRFIQEASTDKARKDLFDAMNDGKVRILFGSTQKLGTGVNAQKRAVAIHHLDIPWRPSDMEQRDGRAVRKGNIVAKEHAGNKVKSYIYAVERSLDAYKFNILHNKQLFIHQLKSRSLATRTIDEGAMDESSGMNYSEYIAILSGNTDLLDKAKLESKIAVLESERQSFQRSKGNSRSKLKEKTDAIAQNKRIIARIERDWEYLNRVAPADRNGVRPNPIIIDGVDSKDPVVIGKKLSKLNRTLNTGNDYQKIGTLFDFRILVRSESTSIKGMKEVFNKFMVEGLDGIKYSYNNGRIASDPKLASTNFIKALDAMPKLIKRYTEDCEELSRDIPTLEKIIKSQWEKESELKALREELVTLNRKITVELEGKGKSGMAEETEAGIIEDEHTEESVELTTLSSEEHPQAVPDSVSIPDDAPASAKHVPGKILPLRSGPKVA